MCDPFCGSGTTLVESLLLGRRAWGIDINPFAIGIAAAKCSLVQRPETLLESRELKRVLHTTQQMMEDSEGDQRRNVKLARGAYHRPIQRELFEQVSSRRRPHLQLNHRELRKWFHSHTYRQLMDIRTMVEQISNVELKLLLETVFISILMAASSHKGKKPYGYFADNVVPKEERYRNAYKLFYLRCRRLLVRVTKMLPSLTRATRDPVVLGLGDAASSDVWGKRQVDCVVTSPPYPGAVDYAMAFRLASYWFPERGDILSVRTHEIGARGLRRRRDSRDVYFTGMHHAFRNMIRALRPGGLLALVLPRGRSQTPTIDRLVRSVLSADHVRQVAKIERRILKRYFVREGGGIKSEVILVFRKGTN